MPDAPLPDRVEAARVAKHLRWALMELEGYDPKWTAPEPMRDAWQCVLDVEVAADACEAERNPNTPDEYVLRGWEDESRLFIRHESQKAMRHVGEWTPLFARRSVSSEDVHREAEE